MITRAVVVSAGMVSALGQGALENGFLYRANHPVMRESALLDEFGQPVTMCFLPTLDPLLAGAERCAWLAQTAVRHALSPLAEPASNTRLKVGLCLDEWTTIPDSGAEHALRHVASLTQDAAQQSAQKRIALELLAEGPASAARLLDRALGELATGACEIALLAGAHTDYSPAFVRQLGAQGRIFSSENLDALVPGEAAAAVALTTEATARRLGLPVLARVHGLNTAWDRARPDNDESAFEAAGLTMAVRGLVETLDVEREPIGWMLSDASYELREIFEWQAVTLRSRRVFCAPEWTDFPAQRLGHLGAAALPVLLTLTAIAWRHGYAPHERALLMLGSDGGERAVLVAGAGDALSSP